MNTDDDAASLIQSLLTRYAAISTYRDHGEVLQARRDGGAPQQIPFATLFRRPNMFRFAFSTTHPYPPLAHIISSHCFGADSVGAYAWTKHHDEPASIEDQESVALAVAGATGISRGAAHTIGVLLLPDIGGYRLDQASSWTVLRNEVLESTECVVVLGNRRGRQQTLWIHEGTMTLRKVITDFGSSPAGVEVRRAIEIDGLVNDNELQRPSAA